MLEAMWTEHRAAPFPADLRGRAVAGVDLAALNASVESCLDQYFQARELDAAHCKTLTQSVTELERVIPALEGEGWEYFRRLEAIAGMLLHHCQSDSPAA